MTTKNNSLSNKTGNWRTHRPEINHQKCIGCSLCAKICPEACIEMKNRKAFVDDDYCKGCALCAHECPVKAIEMKEDF